MSADQIRSAFNDTRTMDIVMQLSGGESERFGPEVEAFVIDEHLVLLAWNLNGVRTGRGKLVSVPNVAALEFVPPLSAAG